MAELKFNKKGRLLFTKEMKKEYTILCPMMLPIHFSLFVDVFRNCGYKVELLTNDGPSIVQEGLKYVHNDTCYPALLVIGQFIDALHSGKYDLDRTALIITLMPMCLFWMNQPIIWIWNLYRLLMKD